MKIHQILINDTNTLPEKFPKFHNFCCKQIKNLYPDEEYHLYDGKELEKIIKNNFPSEVFLSYKKLKPYACKADLARLCLLYLYGGLYIDLNLYLVNTIPNLDLDELEFFAFRDISRSSNPSWSVQNGIIYSLPKSKVVENGIGLIIKHCKEEYYGNQCIDVSATTVLGFAIMKSLPNYKISTNGQLDFINLNYLDKIDKKLVSKLKFLGYTSDNLLGFLTDDDKLIATRKPCDSGDIESLGFRGTNNYVKMWHNKNVFDTSIKFNKNKKVIYI